MKKWVKWFCASLIALVTVLCVSCSRQKYEQEKVDKVQVEDSVWFERMSDAVGNPHFQDGISAYRYQKEEGIKRHQDSVFFSIPKEALLNVSQVLINREVMLTKRNIANEFESGKDIYLNLEKIDKFKQPDSQSCANDTLDGGGD